MTDDLREEVEALQGMFWPFDKTTALAVLILLQDHHDLRVQDIADRLGITSPAVSQHLTRMRGEGMVKYRREKQVKYYEPIREHPVWSLLDNARENVAQAT